MAKSICYSSFQYKWINIYYLYGLIQSRKGLFDGAFILRNKFDNDSDEEFWKASLVNDGSFWKAFFQEYGEKDISAAVLRSMAMKFLCNEAKYGSFDNNRYGGLFEGRLDEEGKYDIRKIFPLGDLNCGINTLAMFN